MSQNSNELQVVRDLVDLKQKLSSPLKLETWLSNLTLPEHNFIKAIIDENKELPPVNLLRIVDP